MTSREKTGLLPLEGSIPERPFSEKALTVAWGAIQWPWLLRSLWGGKLADKQALLDRLGLPHDALPHLGSWKADTWFLWRIVEAIERLRPKEVVELGCGASTLVIAKALDQCGGGRLSSYDQHAGFVESTSHWLESHGLDADLRHAPLVEDSTHWSHVWYALHSLPREIDLLVIDGPPWSLNPFIRGRAETLFDRIVPGGMVLLDDAARPGERLVAARWKRDWPEFEFTLLPGAKGTLIGQRKA
ncbi:MAG TPA: class I SAM-dependent methyltransferase [Croceibacterium sp.]|nr:class I SAM-dependent methyltransferase [Croceibacterium sp.]